MEVNTDEHDMIGDAVNNAALPAFPVSQAGELAIRIVERIGANK